MVHPEEVDDETERRATGPVSFATRRREGDMFEALGLLAAKNGSFHTVLWIIAVVLVIAGIFALLRKAILWGIILIVVGFLVGPGGVSVFK
jgi:uncharacterized membrane protein